MHHHVQQVLEEIGKCSDEDEFFREWRTCLKQAMEESELCINCVGVLCRHPADQKRLVAAAVYHYVHKSASSSARSEEEMFFLSIR